MKPCTNFEKKNVFFLNIRKVQGSLINRKISVLCLNFVLKDSVWFQSVVVKFWRTHFLKLSNSSISCTHGNNEVTNPSRIPNWRQYFCWYFIKKGWSLTHWYELLLYYIWKIIIWYDSAWKVELDHIKILKVFNIFSIKLTFWSFVPFPGGPFL